MAMDVEVGTMWPQAAVHLEPPETGGGRKDSPLGPSDGQ